MNRAYPILIGLDGGGTSCRAALVAGPGSARHEARGGPANVSNFAAAMDSVKSAVAKLLSSAGLDDAALGGAVAHLGLAGVMDARIAARVASEMPFGRTIVTDDQPTMIAGALGSDDGAVAAIGTGSFIGRQLAGAITVLGGWGFALGDQASGAWLGRRLLSEALLAADGLAAPSPLARDTLSRFGGGVGIAAFGLTALPADYAALAPEVVAAAESGDALGDRLMHEGVQYIESALAALGHAPGETLCLTGGLGPLYRRWLDVDMASHITAPKGSALDGALLLAARAASEDAA